jgi:hypothetical protein
LAFFLQKRVVLFWCVKFNIFKSAHALIIDSLDDLGTGGDQNAKQLKLALQDFASWLLLLLLNVCVNTVWHYSTFNKDLQLTW